MYQSLAKRVIITILFLFIYRSTLATKVPLKYAKRYVGQSIGSGECAAGVQEVFYDYYGYWILGYTSSWGRGTKVFGNNIPTGTAIASFNSGGRYDCNYGCHAGVYISQNSNGIQIYDQWSGKNWGIRTLGTTATNPQSNQADRFYVIT
eukprot:330096_1